jgi:hypothetical protein
LGPAERMLVPLSVCFPRLDNAPAHAAKNCSATDLDEGGF